LKKFHNAKDFVASVTPEIRARAQEIERNRGVPSDLARKLAKGGLFHLFTPESFGGLELSPSEAGQIMEDLAEADMSTAWCAMIGSCGALGAAYLDPAVAKAMIPSIETIICGVAAPTGVAVIEGDNYRVSGRWQWGSSSNNSDHLAFGCIIKDPANPGQMPPTAKMVILPVEQVERLDTWYTMGLAGTSSGDLVVKDAIVPIAHSYLPLPEHVRSTGPLYKMPYYSTLALGVAAVALGNAKAALNDVIEIARAKTPVGTGDTLASKPYAQISIVDHTSNLLAARSMFYAVLDRVWAAILAGHTASAVDRAELRMAAVYAGKMAAQVTRGAHELAGGTSVFSENTLQRRLRDAQVATQHRIISDVNKLPVGQTLFGMGSHEFLERHRI
jgi:indole-3-acetate monooxygenase